MDIDLLKTFLEVVKTHSFGKAASNLFITQSAVSARIRLLEGFVSAQLLTRTRNNIQATAAGQKLIPHAEAILDQWARARQEVAAEDLDRVPLAIGAVPSIWDLGLQEWIHALCAEDPALVIQAEVCDTLALLEAIRGHRLDLAVMYEAPQDPALDVLEIASVRLILVSTAPADDPNLAVERGYALVNWGTSFAISHARQFPTLPPPRFRADLGRLAKEFILANGGSAYLADSMVGEEVSQGRLHPVSGAQPMLRRIFAVVAHDSPRPSLLADLRADLANAFSTHAAPVGQASTLRDTGRVD